MRPTRFIRTFARNDLRLFGRDRFLLFMLLFVPALAVVLRFGLPWLNSYLAETGVLPSESVSRSLADFYPLIVSFLAVFEGALIAGTIIGFFMLDEKENDTIKAMLVTPVPLHRYAIYRLGLAAILTFFVILALLLFIDQALPSLWQVLLISAGGSLLAPIITLFYVTFPENKVQGMAYGKFVSIAGMTILFGWFVAEPWQWLFGLFPPFWICKAYWLALEGSAWWWSVLMLGIVLQTGLIALLMKRFRIVAYR